MNNKLKKILVLGYFFPPSSMPASLRLLGFARYFHKYGYYPVFVSRKWESHGGEIHDSFIATRKNIDYIRNNEYEAFLLPYNPSYRDKLFLEYPDHRIYSVVRKLLTFSENIVNGVSLRFNSYNNIYRFADELLSLDNSYYAIIASGNPFLLFKFSSKLSKKHKIPYILDYRDDWNTNQLNKPDYVLQKISSIYSKWLEKKWIKKALFFTTVSDTYKNRIEEFTGKKGYVIMNGFFEIPENKRSEIPSKVLTFLYPGTIYKSQRIEIFLKAFGKFISKYGDVARVLFVGAGFEEGQKKMLEGFLSSDSVKILPRVSSDEMQKIYQVTDIFLQFAYSDFKGIPSTKIFEYISYAKPILLCGSDGDFLERILNETKTGVIVNDSNEAYNKIELFYEQFKNRGIVTVDADINSIKEYSRENQIKGFASIITKELKSTVEYQQCKRCVMDTSDPFIVFDSNGYCNHCNDYLNKTIKLTYHGQESEILLEKLVKKIKRSGGGKKYNCIVGLSGGADSCYTLYLSVIKGLRPLAVHMDNGWDSERAVYNIERMVKALNVDLYSCVLDWKVFKELQLAFLKASVIEAETPTDIAIPAVLHEIAEKYGVKYILSGGNYATEGILPKYWHYNAKDTKYINSVFKKFGKGSLNSFPLFGYKREFYCKVIKGIRMVYPLNHIDFNKKEVIKFLEKEFGWKYYFGKHHESVYTRLIHTYVLPLKFGIDYRLATYSTKICSGQMSREEALNELSAKSHADIDINQEIDFLCRKMEISKTEFEEIVNRPARSYKNYPNDEIKLNFIYSIYRLVKRITN